jgi:hypothetical protein
VSCGFETDGPDESINVIDYALIEAIEFAIAFAARFGDLH